MDWFAYDFDHPAYFDHYRDKEADAAEEGPALAALLGLAPGSTVLDLPCGWGRLRPALEARHYRVVGGDLSPLNLQRHGLEHPGAILRLDFRSLPFRAACADGVFCAFTSWGYFATQEENLRQLQEFARVLKPGGTLLLDLCGREALERGVASTEGRWVELEDLGYRERVRWSPDRSRIWTERTQGGFSFRHDIWIPTDQEVRAFLDAAGFELEDAFGGLQGGPWTRDAERWIYRALKPRLPASPG
ncbi:MAG: class I SAM-dependent methyltransferase [Acidobacteriota bacterium]|nr:class I SAM-dependent methyltransferase [Acidobacteriota bacterium]